MGSGSNGENGLARQQIGRKVRKILFSWAPKSLWTVTAAMKLKDACFLEKIAMTNLGSILKSRDASLQIKIRIVKALGFPVVTHIWMWDWDHKEFIFQIVVLEKTPESPLDCKEIQPVNPKGNQQWIFIGRTDAKAEAPVLWPPDAKSWLTGKGPDAGKDWGQKEKGTEDEMVGWQHWLSGHEFEHALGDRGQASLVCCRPWGHRVRYNLATEKTTTRGRSKGDRLKRDLRIWIPKDQKFFGEGEGKEREIAQRSEGLGESQGRSQRKGGYGCNQVCRVDGKKLVTLFPGSIRGWTVGTEDRIWDLKRMENIWNRQYREVRKYVFVALCWGLILGNVPSGIRHVFAW